MKKVAKQTANCQLLILDCNMFFFGLRKAPPKIFISWVTDAEQVYGQTIGLVAKMRPAKRREVELVELKAGHPGKLRWEPEFYIPVWARKIIFQTFIFWVQGCRHHDFYGFE